MTIAEIVFREVRALDEPMPCSASCHESNVPWHEPACPANESNRLCAMGLAVAKAVVEDAERLREAARKVVWFADQPESYRDEKSIYAAIEAMNELRAALAAPVAAKDDGWKDDGSCTQPGCSGWHKKGEVKR